jgi:hypothetical protein
MKIDIISSDGIHASEKDALERMRQAFNASEFSQAWQGYAGFMMMDTTYRDREIDLVLLTHDRLLLIELKKWRGKIEPMQDHWLRDGDDMGRSPVKVLADKWKILSSKIRARLSEPARSVYIDYRVVMCGSADFSAISDDERKYVITLEQFLKIARLGGYRQEFGTSYAGKPNNHLQVFTQFFRGREFKPSGFSFGNFQIVGEATFPHPLGLYKEYKSVKKDDQRHEALLRRWDFSVLTGIADTLDERARIALREHKVLGFIHEQCEQLDGVVLQPLSHSTRDDIDADFCELYRLPSRQLRLNEFVQRYGQDMAYAERLALLKVVLSHFADLHDAGVAHRDVSDHSLWLERPSKVSISGFLTAYFPEAGTVGPLRDNLRAGQAVLPEDSELGHGDREVDRLTGKYEESNATPEEPTSLSARIGQRSERFRTLAREKFGVEDASNREGVVRELHRTTMKKHGVTSPDAVAKLDQVMLMSQEWVDRLGTLRGNFEEFLAKTRSLVCGTCVGLGRSQFGVAKNRYDWVIVDEAARATPGELAVAIQSGRRVLLVGDHRQLPPLYSKQQVQRIAADLQWTDRSALVRSDFERAFESQYGQRVGATLQTQYRMAPPIGELVSACFYPVPLQPGRGDAPAWFKDLPNRIQAVVTWIDTSEGGRESHDRPKEPGFDNLYEAREILDLLRSICTSGTFIESLIANCADDEKPIGIICMYAEQQRLLQRLFSEQDWATGYRRLIKIDTVDSYQGKENRIIIVATTRNNSYYDQGFLSSRERVNVAISRAMDRLVIVGAARMWRERNQRSPLGLVLAHVESHRDKLAFSMVEASHNTGKRT